MPERRNIFGRRKKTLHRYAAHQVAVPMVEETMRQLSASLDAWQAKVLKLAEIVPEVMTGYSFVQNVMDLVTFEIQRFDRVTSEWVEDRTPVMKGVERRINGSFKAGRAAALGHLVAETFLLVTRTPNNDFKFETLAPTEIRTKNKNVVEQRVLVDGEKDQWVKVDEARTTIIRIFTPDPADRNKASGPHKPLLGLLETMALEMSREQADAISVLAGNGILFIPTEILPDEVDTLDASSTPGSRRGFEDRLEEAMVSTITDRSKGEAIVPVLLYGPAEAGTAIRHILPTRSESPKDAQDRMTGYVERYARDIDLPRQVVLGTGDANHWGDWLVDPNTWTYHLSPAGQRIADGLYAGIVAGIIENLGFDTTEYRLVPNASQATVKADQSGTATEVYKTGALRPEAYIEAAGFAAEDMRPDAEEALLALLSSGPDDDQYLNAPPTAPSRTAAGKSPLVILRQASNIANAQQVRLEKLYRKYLIKIAEDAARAGRASGKAAEKAAASKVKFAGYEPQVYFDRYAAEIETATNEELLNFLRRISTLTNTDYRSVKAIWANEFAARAQHVTTQARFLAESVSKRSFESGKPAFIGDNSIRALSSTANGGVNATNGAAGNSYHPTHAAQDPVLRDQLTESVGAFATQYTWQVGDPQRPFEPHQELDGVTWFSWEEFDVLDVSGADSWLPGNVYFPGDHEGCQCEYSVEFVPISEAT